MNVRSLVRGALHRFGYDIVKRRDQRPGGYPVDFEPFHRTTLATIRANTLTSDERVFGLIEAVRHIVAAGIPGALVECGVFKGGSVQAMALTLMEASACDRDLYLYDSFEGMPAPQDIDVDAWGVPARRVFDRTKTSEVSSHWALGPLEGVREVMASTGYPPERIHYVQGLVEDTIPATVPDAIALLRLDTDWYQSTKHEMEHLYPRLVPGGILIIDDYGHYEGARRAIDEYFEQLGQRPFMNRLDYSGRLVIKPGPHPAPTAGG